MQSVTRSQVVEALQSLGLCAGDGLFVHSAVQFLGVPQGGVGIFLDAIRAVIDPGGTLAVPTFNFEFAKGKPYSREETPSAGMGVFSEYVRRQPGFLRSPHPLQSISAGGLWAADLTGRDTPSAFDPGSAFERMLDLDFKLVFLGAGIQAASLVHYSEQRAAVPYRYWKDFTGSVHTPAGTELRTYRMFVRDLQTDPQLKLAPIEAALKTRGQWREAPLNYGRIALCRFRDFTAATDDLLAQDPWALVENRPAPTPNPE